MIVKEVINEELLTLAEVKEILSKIAEERREQGIEVGYGFRKALHHADQFSKISGKKSRELVNRLLQLEKMKPVNCGQDRRHSTSIQRRNQINLCKRKVYPEQRRAGSDSRLRAGDYGIS